MTKTTKVQAQKKADEDANLNEALVETFPASDPLSITQPRTGADVPEDQRDARGEKCGPGGQSRRSHIDGCATHVIDDIGKRDGGTIRGNENAQ